MALVNGFVRRQDFPGLWWWWLWWCGGNGFYRAHIRDVLRVFCDNGEKKMETTTRVALKIYRGKI